MRFGVKKCIGVLTTRAMHDNICKLTKAHEVDLRGDPVAGADESQYYTVPQAARTLQVSATTIWRWIQAGKLPAFRVGDRNIRIRKEDLETVIQPIAAMPKQTTPEKAGYTPAPVSEEALARRKAIVSKILEAREGRDISPLTSADLVRKVRKEAMRKFERHGKAR